LNVGADHPGADVHVQQFSGSVVKDLFDMLPLQRAVGILVINAGNDVADAHIFNRLCSFGGQHQRPCPEAVFVQQLQAALRKRVLFRRGGGLFAGVGGAEGGDSGAFANRERGACRRVIDVARAVGGDGV
jgi:hypothetical protein